MSDRGGRTSEEGQKETAARAATRNRDRILDMNRNYPAGRDRRADGSMVRSREARETVMWGEHLARAVKVERARQRM